MKKEKMDFPHMKRFKEMIDQNEFKIEDNMITTTKPTSILVYDLAADLATHRIAFLQVKNICKEEDIVTYNELGETKYTEFAQDLFWMYFVHFAEIINSHKADK